jgi:hypothetical protein
LEAAKKSEQRKAE